MQNLTISQVVEGYNIFAQTRLSPNTIRDYSTTITRFQEFLGVDMLFDDIKVDLIESFLFSHRNLSKKTIKNYHTGLSALWSWAHERKFVSEKVPQQYRPPKPDQIEIAPYSEADVKALMAYCMTSKPYQRLGQRQTKHSLPTGTRWKTTLMVLLDTGIRASEFCNMQIRDVDLSNKSIKVFGKGRKERIIPVSPRTAQVLWTYLSSQRDQTVNSSVFITEEGFPMSRNNLLNGIKRLGERAGVHGANVHRFRHTFAITFLRNGGDVYTLQRILGHSTLDMVKRYLSIAQVDIQAAHRLASPVMNWRL